MECLTNKKEMASTETWKKGSNPIQSQDLKALLKLSRQLNTIHHSNHFFSSILVKIHELFDFNHAGLYILEPDHKTFKCISKFKKGPFPKQENTISLSEILKTITETKKYLIWGENRNKKGVPLDPNLKQLEILFVPLLFDKQVLGVIRFDRMGKKTFNTDEIEMANIIADQLAVNLTHSILKKRTRNLEKQTHRLMEGINIPLFFCDGKGKLTRMNQALIDLFGFKNKTQALKTNLFNHIILYPSKKNTFKQLMNKCGYFKNLEVQLRRCDNQVITVLINILPIRKSNKKFVGYEGMIQDISEKRDLEAQLLQAQKLGALGSLVGGIAHDFNNLIAGIMGCASLLMTEVSQKSPYYSDIHTILNASQKAADLSAQLLSFTRQDKHNIKTIIINNMISEVLNLLSRTINKSIQINANLTPDILPIEVNPIQIQQALMNICINGRDAMPQGGQLTIVTSNTLVDDQSQDDLKPGQYITIQISDTGIGMDETTQKRIFEPFFTTKTKNQGNGLGLATASEIIKNHGGIITVESEVNEGSTFSIYLPVSINNVDAEIEHCEFENLPKGAETILLVDDEEVIRKMGKRMLEMFGYHVLLADNGKQAINVYKKSCESIHLLILDMIMPELDGKMTLREIKMINPNVKALLTSGFEFYEKRDEHIAHGFSGYIKKPFMAGEILRIIRKTIEDPLPA